MCVTSEVPVNVCLYIIPFNHFDNIGTQCTGSGKPQGALALKRVLLAQNGWPTCTATWLLAYPACVLDSFAGHRWTLSDDRSLSQCAIPYEALSLFYGRRKDKSRLL